MEGRRFIDTAELLLERNSPSNCRTVFNRAYYAAYNTGVELFEKAGVTINENAKGHTQVSTYLQQCGVPKLNEAGSKLGDLYSDRILADYRLNKTNVEKLNNAKLAVLRAKMIISTFDLFSSSSERQKIKKGIERYNKKIESASMEHS